MHQLDEILKLRSNKEVYLDFCNYILKPTLPETLRNWEKLSTEDKKTNFCMDTVATTADEAFVLLTVVNSYETWSKMSTAAYQETVEEIKDTYEAKSKGRKEAMAKLRKDLPRKKYTSRDRDGTGGSTRRNEGWNAAGMQYFCQLAEKVEEDRDERGDEFDAYVTKHYEEKKKRAEDNNGKQKGADGGAPSNKKRPKQVLCIGKRRRIDRSKKKQDKATSKKTTNNNKTSEKQQQQQLVADNDNGSNDNDGQQKKLIDMTNDIGKLPVQATEEHSV